jgi:hypothetical protein
LSLRRVRISGKIKLSDRIIPGFAGHRPAFHGGFCVSRWAVLHGRRMPANLPVGRDLTIRRKIENGRYYCAFGRSKAHDRIRAPALNPRDPEAAAEAAVCEAVYAYPNRPAVRFDVSAGINVEYGPRKRSPAASRRR